MKRFSKNRSNSNSRCCAACFVAFSFVVAIIKSIVIAMLLFVLRLNDLTIVRIMEYAQSIRYKASAQKVFAPAC